MLIGLSKTGQQFANNNDDVRTGLTGFELSPQYFVVLPGRAEAVHHPFPENEHVVIDVSVGIFTALPVVGGAK